MRRQFATGKARTAAVAAPPPSVCEPRSERGRWRLRRPGSQETPGAANGGAGTESVPRTCPQIDGSSSSHSGALCLQVLWLLPLSPRPSTPSFSEEVLYGVSCGNEKAYLQRLRSQESPLADSNRRPPPYHGGFEPLLGDLGNALGRALSCYSLVFFAWSTPSLGDPELPREAPNLSPEPSPNGTRACSPRWQQSVAGIPPWAAELSAPAASGSVLNPSADGRTPRCRPAPGRGSLGRFFKERSLLPSSGG